MVGGSQQDRSPCFTGIWQLGLRVGPERIKGGAVGKRSIPTILVAVVAAIAVTGGVAAASGYVITSIHQIKPSVRAKLRGPRGHTGPRGATGAQGAAGAFSTSNVEVVTGPTVSMCASPGGDCQTAGSYASCPTGAVALGGGWQGPVVDTTVGDNYPIGNDTAWEVVMSNDSYISESFTPYAVCAAGGGALTAHASRAALQAVVSQQVAAVRATLK